MSKWYREDGKYILETENGCAIIEHSIPNMTKLLIKNKNGIPRDGYAQYQQPLEKEKRIAELRLKQIY